MWCCAQFKPPAALSALRRRAHEIVESFDPQAGSGVFSTRDQNADAWFLGSADSVRCFFEEDAFDGNGGLRQPKALSINKIGHALHELDPVFAAFSHGPDWAELANDLGLEAPQLWQSMFIFKQPGIGGEVRWHQDATFLHSEPITVTGFWIALEDATRRQRLPVGGARRPSRAAAPALRARRRCGAFRDARRDAVARHPRGACRSKCRPARWCASTACCRTTAHPIARRSRAMRTRCMPSTAAAAGRATTGCGARGAAAAFDPRDDAHEQRAAPIDGVRPLPAQ